MSGTLLLIEDDPDEADLFRLAASEVGIRCDLQTARSGEEALDLLLSRRCKPLAVILDLKMPGIGGLETLRRLRAQPELRGLAVFVLTSSDLAEDKASAWRLGCDAFFVKPITFSSYVEMASRIKVLLPPCAASAQAS